ncbi:MAG TPA: amidohydrolase family protein [Chthoniobacteraceae bacterium]|nr:amidohydrolase family protein [Chthoniobacteraceae bacterium]
MTIIDVDIHQSWEDPLELTRRLPAHFREMDYALPGGMYSSPVGVSRFDARGDHGESAGSSYQKLKEQHLDAFGISKALLTGGDTLSLGVHPHAEYARHLARAYNDAVLDLWLPCDPRLYASLIIAPQNPQTAAEEIRRLGGHPRIVEVLMCSASRLPFGNAFYWPIYEAAQEMGLPVACHPGAETRGVSNGFVAGPASTYIEWHTNLNQGYMGHVVSLICEGVFEKFPRLKFVAKEGGLAWIPGVLWRLDKNWKALRSSVPWVKKLPSEYLIEHVRFTSQPIEEPANVEHLLALFDIIQAEKTVLFASDYPHWDNDSPRHALPARLPENMKKRIMSLNALETYLFPESSSIQ